MANPNLRPSENSESAGGCLPALARLTWIFGGIALLYCGLFIAQAKAPVIADLILLILTLGLILVRYIDIRYLKGETRDNQPATMRHWRRYALMILIFSGFLYALAKFAASKNLL